MAITLQRPLFQDKYVGIVDSHQIMAILWDVIHHMKRVWTSIHGDPVLHEAYLYQIVSPPFPGQLRINCGGWSDVPRTVRIGSPLTVSFCYKDRAYYFETKVVSVHGASFHIPFPKSLIYYPQRRVPRFMFPLQIPITAVFLNPCYQREKLVRELEDVGYNGLSFRTLSQERPPLLGSLIKQLGLYSFEYCCYSFSAEVNHIAPCCNFQGERYYRVGLVFDRKEEFIHKIRPFLQEGECEEITDTSEIRECLRDLKKFNIPIQLQDASQRRPHVKAAVDAVTNDEETFISLRTSQKKLSRVSLLMGEQVRIQYAMYGTQYFFDTFVSRVLLDIVIVKLPESITWMRRRRNLRCRLSEGKKVRIHFKHPLLDNKVVRKVLSLSEEGLSISFDYKRVPLFPNMRIEKAELELDGRRYPLSGLCITSADTLPSSTGRPQSRVGILFQSLPEITRRVIHPLIEEEYRPFIKKATRQLIPDVWELFYKSGFIYPEKQASIQKKEKEIRQTWEALHSPENPFFLNLVFRKDGNVLGTAAIVQAYEESWILQHLSALKSSSVAASKEVNLGIAEDLIRNKRVRYLKIYFRKNNPWPNKNFRTFAEKHLPKKLYDLTLFRFYQKDCRPIPSSGSLPAGVQLGEVKNGDQEIIRNYFVQKGKILYSRSESLFGLNLDLPETSRLYRSRGLRRQRRIFVVKKDLKILCFAVAEDASYGVNLSGLLNTFRIYEVWKDPEVLYQVLPVLINKVLGFYRSLRYENVTFMASETDDAFLNSWGFTRRHDYYCLTMHRESLIHYLHYIREKYGRVEHRMLRRIK